jgi:hypothetical protein
MVNIRLIQAQSEIDYRHTQINRRQQRSTASSVLGTMADYDPATGQQKINLPDGGVMRAKSISNSGIRLGDVVPAISRNLGGAFLDSRG